MTEHEITRAATRIATQFQAAIGFSDARALWLVSEICELGNTAAGLGEDSKVVDLRDSQRKQMNHAP